MAVGPAQVIVLIIIIGIVRAGMVFANHGSSLGRVRPVQSKPDYKTENRGDTSSFPKKEEK